MARRSLRLCVLALVLAGLAGLAGCRSCWDRLGGGGCGGGGGCCRGVNPERHQETAATKCPVSGEELGSMGTPVPVEVNGRAVMVCCEGCAKQLKRDPGHYLGGVE